MLRYLECSRRSLVKWSSQEALAALDSLAGYLEPLLPITDYVEYGQKDYVIESGMMESTCKQSVDQRLKVGERRWSEGGSVAVAAPKHRMIAILRGMHPISPESQLCLDIRPITR